MPPVVPDDERVVDAQRQVVKKPAAAGQRFARAVKNVLGSHQHHHQAHQHDGADQASAPQVFRGPAVAHLFCLGGGDNLLRPVRRLISDT